MPQQVFPTTRSKPHHWIGGLLFVAAFFALLHITQPEEEPTATTAEASDTAKQKTRLQRAALALCASEVGPGAKALWTREGDLVCRPAVVMAGAEAPK